MSTPSSDEERIKESLTVPGSDDSFVLLDRNVQPRRKNYRNLVRRRADGSEVWRAELPDPSGPDTWVEVRWEGESLVAWSWSCFHCHLDPETGKLLSRLFIK